MNANFLTISLLIILGKSEYSFCSDTHWSIVPSRAINATLRSITDSNRVVVNSDPNDSVQVYPQYNTNFQWFYNPNTNRYEPNYEKNMEENSTGNPQENSVYENNSGPKTIPLQPHEMNTKEIVPLMSPNRIDSKPNTVVVAPDLLKGLETVRASVMSIVERIRNICEYVWNWFSPGGSKIYDCEFCFL